MAVETTARALDGDAGRTMVALWQGASSRGSGHAAFLVNEARGVWREVGWEEARERVDELAAGFLELGIGKGDRVAILAQTRIEWTLCDYALLSIGAVVVPIYQTSSRDECAYILADAGACAVVCEDAEQLEKVAGLALPALKLTVAFEDAGDDGMSLERVSGLGREALTARGPVALADARAAVSSTDPLTCIYTSGTTGDPKGCILTHGNWWSIVESVKGVDGLMASGDVALLFLPLAHNFARLVQFVGAGAGFTIAFVPDINRVARALAEVRPTVFPSVPRLFERVYTTVHKRLTQEKGIKGLLARRSLAVGLRASRVRQRGRRPGPFLALQVRIADKLVFTKIKERFGGRIKHAVSGGAALAPEIIEFFDACGVLILEGYGLTETTSACTVNRPDRYRFGSVGPALPGIEVALAEDDEIMIRGNTLFGGYHGAPEATAEVITDDGWLLTGDIGTIDEDGFVTIVDRKKELIVTSGGKKISPYNLESALKASPYIAQALVVGEGRSHVAALVYPDPDEVAKVASGEEGIRELVQGVVDEVNAPRGPVEQIRRFALLPRDFSAEEGEITPTLKLKRRVCEAHFAEEIERLFGADRGRS
jgi:long-chain acyl-CoA synthetase